MKVLIAIVMFLFGVFVGILVMPMFKEFSTSMYIEEEYSSPRIKSLLREFDITLPLEAADVNLFLKQDGLKKKIWLKFECSPEVRDDFISRLTSRHAGMFNREIESPTMLDGTVITWWGYRNSFRYYEFNGMCAAYDETLRQLYLYAVSDEGGEQERSFSDAELSVD
jgi:hypothetical protein